MKHLARKKIVLIIVEGPSDETALGIALRQFFDQEKVMVCVIHGDITTRTGVNSQNIVDRVFDEVRKFIRQNYLSLSDLSQLIHIVDTDAAFLDGKYIYDAVDCDSVRYSDDGIYTRFREKIISRNHQKSENLFRLRKRNEIRKIPYKVYYMSCNLEHVLYDQRECSDEEKEAYAHQFEKQYKGAKDAFAELMCCSDFSVTGGYSESWEYIESGLHSIERHSNLGICLEEKT